MANECDEKTLRIIKAKEIFYQVRAVYIYIGSERGDGWWSDERGREGGRKGE